MKTKLLFFSFLGSLLAHAQTLDFKHLANMSAGRGAITSVIVDDNIYVSNGYQENGGNANFIEKYNITDNKWSVLNSTLIPKKFANSETYNNKIYIFNGWGNSHLEIFDLATNTITKGAVNHSYTGNAGSAIYNGKIYVFGGSGLNGAKSTVFSDRFQYYDIASNTWHPLPNMPTAREAKGKIVNDKLYVIGGFNGTSSRLVNVYDLNANLWIKQYTMPAGISGHSLAVSGNKIFIAGGYNNQTFMAYFDTTTNKLHQLSSNMIPRRHAAAEVYNNKLYIIGGSTTSLTKSSIKSIQAADISDSVLAVNTPTKNRVLETKVYTNASRDGFVISNKNNSNQFEYTVYSTDGGQIIKGFAYYNKTIDLSRVRPGTYIFTFKNEKGILQQIRIVR
ncbi:T9SS type A sorting domain-containing protein [Chryseobacterium sp. Tr-659]|uniref:T9SS C-terminal target domain-containing protein n=1 Tax=Chryseobacterium sp. Tr-659 TaxID=2608340 RepID=UPI001422277E|nr:T9SS C-terminal target domain-containing protein [Chryseobacterium sp. Tr-659]NIF03967.1 T9SS type A sorting domain-containing protein [Chryseobacterium sp. Tr-659]